ncbi:chemotaxis protein CheC [Oceanobacillus sp. FSL H7-0719]|uniref:chemotaxis protein CheC n=1 Tax=Oceanobacillus sp. FSL H7-0719 TaxID=2954507 RepID=UPI003255ADF9
MSFTNLTSMHVDVLREIGNIGAGNATTSLSQLLNKKIDMVLPSVNIVTFDEMIELIGSPEEIVVAVLFRIYGDAPSTVILILTVAEAETLVRSMTNNPEFTLTMDVSSDQMAMSALEEVGNIVAGSYIAALSDFTGLHLQPSVPHLGIDMAASILTYGLIELSQVSDHAIVIDSKVDSNEQENTMKGNLFLLPNPDSLNVIFQALGINHNE